MEVLVALATKKVIKYDEDNNIVHIYDSIKECAKDLNLTIDQFRMLEKNNKNINGFYYKKQNPEITSKIIPCAYCGKLVEVFKARYENRSLIFCSKKCESEYKISHRTLNATCAYCGMAIHRKPSQIKKNNNCYCSVECLNNAKKILYTNNGNHQFGLKGELNSSWKSNERISYYGYKLIRSLTHPFRNCDDFVFEHRLVAEKYLLTEDNSVEIDGRRYLKNEYVVHHLDFNRLNNNITNLMVMERNEHTKLHQLLRTTLDFKKYCSLYNLDLEEVKNNHDYNVKYYNYKRVS